MYTFIKVLGIVTISLYAIVSFISLAPNPSTWDTGGRAAFVAFAIIFSLAGTAIFEDSQTK